MKNKPQRRVIKQNGTMTLPCGSIVYFDPEHVEKVKQFNACWRLEKCVNTWYVRTTVYEPETQKPRGQHLTYVLFGRPYKGWGYCCVDRDPCNLRSDNVALAPMAVIRRATHPFLCSRVKNKCSYSWKVNSNNLRVTFSTEIEATAYISNTRAEQIAELKTYLLAR